ncbi:MAG: hypothetical protein BWY52_03033 [Chloroflexi bacterium ADurb.Bin325]|nr:MAG: hypothetical protein BWY52_03033 [Chloroflexi bacterium ADurb.Bin325]
MNPMNRYSQIIEHVFFRHYEPQLDEVCFERDELVQAAQELQAPLPKNLGDVIYTFRYRGSLPDSIRVTAPPGKEWLIRPAGRGRYCFVASRLTTIAPTPGLADIKVPNATPGILTRYALSDEQALLAIIRYNRLIDIFTRVVCYSLQSHLRTTVKGMGQIETDEVYIGIDNNGAHYVFPVQAKAGRDVINVVQIEQDLAMCAAKFPGLIRRAIAAQFLGNELIALFALEETPHGVAIVSERHYRLVPPENLSAEELAAYRMSSL